MLIAEGAEALAAYGLRQITQSSSKNDIYVGQGWDKPLGPLEVDLRDLVVLEHGDTLLADVDGHEQLALRLRKRCPAWRLAAPALLRALMLALIILLRRAVPRAPAYLIAIVAGAAPRSAPKIRVMNR